MTNLNFDPEEIRSRKMRIILTLITLGILALFFYDIANLLTGNESLIPIGHLAGIFGFWCVLLLLVGSLQALLPGCNQESKLMKVWRLTRRR
jgi:Na+/H+-dicarboxylate symporter